MSLLSQSKMASWKLCVFSLLLSALGALGQDEAQKHRNELFNEALTSIIPEIRGTLGLEDIHFQWSWRHWLLFHQDVNLTCRWGSVYPLEQLQLAAPVQELQPSASGARILSAPLGSSRLTFRYDNCVLIKGSDRDTEPLWGNLNESEFEAELSLTANQNRCRATITKLSLKEPKLNYHKDSGIVTVVKDNGSLEELSGAILGQINSNVAAELKKFVGKTYNLSRPC